MGNPVIWPQILGAALLAPMIFSPDLALARTSWLSLRTRPPHPSHLRLPKQRLAGRREGTEEGEGRRGNVGKELQAYSGRASVRRRGRGRVASRLQAKLQATTHGPGK